MAEFSLNTVPEEQQEFTLPDTQEQKPMSASALEIYTAINAARMDFDSEFIRKELERVGPRFLEVSARRESSYIVASDNIRKRNRAIEVSSLPDLVQAEDDLQKENEVALSTSSPDTYAAGRGSLLSHKEAQVNARTTTMMRVVDEILSREGKKADVLSVIGDLTDVVLSATLDGITLQGFKRADTAQRIRALMVADIPEAEFESELRTALEEANDAGWFTNSNILYLMSFAENVIQGGEGFEATFDKFATVVDAGTVGLGATKFLKSSTALAALIGGPKQAAKHLNSALKNPDDVLRSVNAGVPQEINPSYTRLPEQRQGFLWTGPNIELAARQAEENTYLNLVRDAFALNPIDPQVFAEWKPNGLRLLREKIEDTSHNRILDLDVKYDDSGNPFGIVRFGKTNGQMFIDARTAEKEAKRLGGRVDFEWIGDRNYYWIEVEKNLPSEGLARELTNDEIGTGVFSIPSIIPFGRLNDAEIFLPFLEDLKVYGGSHLTLPDRLDSLAKFGEGVGAGIVKTIGSRLKQGYKGLGSGEDKIVERVFFEMRDGDSLSNMTRPLNRAEFISEWAKHSKTAPSERAIDLYFEIQELNDALYYLKADGIFKRVVNDGFDNVAMFKFAREDGEVDEWHMIVKGRTDIAADDTALVKNPISGEEFAANAAPRGKKIYEVAGGYNVGGVDYKYITFDQPQIRRLFHTDVLGYNPGGPRQYSFLNHVVKQETNFSVAHADGIRQGAGRPTSILGTATRQEAEVAVEQINNIFKGFREKLSNLQGMSKARAIDAIESLRTDPELEELIRLNNDWNVNIETIDEFVDFLRGNRVDPRVNVGTAAMDDALAVADDAGILRFSSRGNTYRDLFEYAMNRPQNSPRRRLPLRGFGGGQLETRSPLDTIQNDFLRVLHSKSLDAFNFQSVNGWLKGAEPHIKNFGDIKHLEPLMAMKMAEFSVKPTREARNYMAARDTIFRVLGRQNEYGTKWNSFIDRTAEWVYDKAKTPKLISEQRAAIKAGGNPELSRLQKFSVALAKKSKNPIEYLRGWSFDARLGMFAFDQVLVQASQSANIAAVMGLKRNLTGEFAQSLISHLPLRLAMETTDENVIRTIGRRAGLLIGMDEEEFLAWTKFVRRSGRLEVGGEVAERSAVNYDLARGYASKLRESSRVFFNEGEKVPRSTAMHVAWKEYRQKFPKADPFSEHGLKWITNRQDKLTAAMTRAAAASWQQGVLSIPLQFMTYVSRMLESLFTNRLLSVEERRRLFAAQMLFWGSAGVGMGGFLDRWLIESGNQIDEETYTVLRYGLLNAAVNEMIGTHNTAFGGRLAPAEGISAFMDNLSDNNFTEIIGGPAIALVKDVGLDLSQIVQDIYAGRSSMREADLKKTFRNATSFNRAYQAWLMYTTGDYLNKRGNPIVSGLTKTDAIMTFLGASIQDANFTYSRLDVMLNQDEHLKTHGLRLRQMVDEMTRQIDAGNYDAAREIGREIALLNSVLPVWAREKTKRYWYPELGTMSERYMRLMISRGQGIVKRATETEGE